MALFSLQLVVGNVPEKGNANQDGIRIIEIMDSESKIDVAKWNPRNKVNTINITMVIQDSLVLRQFAS